MGHILLHNIKQKTTTKIFSYIILISFLFIFVSHNVFSQSLKRTPYNPITNKFERKSSTITDEYDDSQSKNRPNSAQRNISNNNYDTATANNYGVFTGQLGEDISNDILSLELKALDVAYSIDAVKLFSLTIKNISYERYTINLSDNYVHNIFLDVYDEMHIPLSIPSSLLVERNNDYVTYRSITIEPSESITITIDLSDYVNITESGVYKVSARFYPEKYIDISQRGFSKSQSQHFIESKYLLISIMNVNNLSRDFDTETSSYTDIFNNSKLITREYSPYDVVKSALSALKDRNWDIFFSHVDLHDLFTNSVTTSDTFKMLSHEERQLEITQYMRRIKNSNEINDLHPPEMFTIDETQYTSFNAHVQVSVRVLERYSILLYNYSFYLTKKANGWKITNYNIKYLGLDALDTVGSSLGTNNDYVSPSEF